MPTYLYRCPACGHEFRELLWSTETDADVSCPQCERTGPERQLPRSFAAQKGAASEPAPFCGRCGENRPPCSQR